MRPRVARNDRGRRGVHDRRHLAAHHLASARTPRVDRSGSARGRLSAPGRDALGDGGRNGRRAGHRSRVARRPQRPPGCPDRSPRADRQAPLSARRVASLVHFRGRLRRGFTSSRPIGWPAPRPTSCPTPMPPAPAGSRRRLSPSGQHAPRHSSGWRPPAPPVRLVDSSEALTSSWRDAWHAMMMSAEGGPHWPDPGAVPANATFVLRATQAYLAAQGFRFPSHRPRPGAGRGRRCFSSSGRARALSPWPRSATWSGSASPEKPKVDPRHGDNAQSHLAAQLRSKARSGPNLVPQQCGPLVVLARDGFVELLAQRLLDGEVFRILVFKHVKLAEPTSSSVVARSARARPTIPYGGRSTASSLREPPVKASSGFRRSNASAAAACVR